jgi:hypothetical protein
MAGSPTSFINPEDPLGINARSGLMNNPYAVNFLTPTTRAADPNNPTSSVPAFMERPTGYADAASLIGAYGSGQKANRALEGQFQQGYDRIMLDTQQDRRAEEADALKKLQQTQYLLGGGSTFNPGAVSVNGKTYNIDTHGLGPQAVTEAEKQGAQSLNDAMLKRLQPGGSYTPKNIDSYAKPGAAERFTDIAAPIVGGIGALDMITGGRTGDYISKLLHIGGGGAASAASAAGAGGAGAAGAGASGAGAGAGNVAGAAGSGAGAANFLLTKAAPIAGIGYGSYELAKNKSLGHDVLGGASAGAGVGTLIAPGIGTAIGAGIGALGGWGRHAFGGPDQVEKAGRGAASEAFGQLGSMATASQKQEAANAGWAHPEEALAMITMRDKLIAQGMSPEQAGQQASAAMNSIWGATKHGDKAVGSAIDGLMAARG